MQKIEIPIDTSSIKQSDVDFIVRAMAHFAESLEAASQRGFHGTIGVRISRHNHSFKNMRIITERNVE